MCSASAELPTILVFRFRAGKGGVSEYGRGVTASRRRSAPRSTRSCRGGKAGAPWPQSERTRGKCPSAQCPSALGAEESPRRDEGTARWRTAGLRVGEEGGTGPVGGELRGLVAGGSRPWGGSAHVKPPSPVSLLRSTDSTGCISFPNCTPLISFPKSKF
jgi:hypothetical protein